jgi:hypothetical protein
MWIRAGLAVWVVPLAVVFILVLFFAMDDRYVQPSFCLKFIWETKEENYTKI